MGTLNARSRILFPAVAVLIAFALGFALRGGGGSGPGGEAGAAAETEATVWTCSMHPQIQLPRPGPCPLCGMDLIPLEGGGDDDGGGPTSLRLSERAAKLAEIRTEPVRRQTVEKRLRMAGKLEADETRVREITARVAGRIDRLFIDYTGVRVRSGEKLFEIYSPELYSAQEELLQAVQARETLLHSSIASTRASAERTIQASRDRLRLWGLTVSQIEAIETQGSATDHVTIVAPVAGTILHKAAVEGTYVQTGTHVYSIADLSGLWLKLDVYESDLPWVRAGQTVRFETEAYPGERFEGVVSFVDPVLTERTRTVKARVDVPNPDGRLLPGLFVRAVIEAPIADTGDGPPLVVPVTAPLLTGKRAVVYVAHPEEPGRFDGRVVSLGPRAGDWYVVREGLAEGEIVVTNGAFKIDSALQILAKPSMMNPEGGGPPPGHHHGDAPAAPGRDHGGGEAPEPFATVPQGFRRGVDRLLESYYALGSALSLDDVATAKTAARELTEVLGDVDASALPGEAAGVWDGLRLELTRRTDALAAAGNLAAARREFLHVSGRLIETVRLFGATGATPALVYHCPMAFDNAGADWLQAGGGTENPYYGSMMFKCGAARETLVAAPDAAAGNDAHAGH